MQPRSSTPCQSAFPKASERTVGNTTYDNRQLSVEEVLCTDFGKSSGSSPIGGVFCTLLAAAIGERFERLGLFTDGACSAKSVAEHDDPAGIACGGLVSLIGAVTDLSPELKVYALGAGVACDTGHSLGSWIEAEQEKRAAAAVWRKGKNALKPGECLKFVTHGFPHGDDWLPTRCAANDPGFSTGADASLESCRPALTWQPTDPSYHGYSLIVDGLKVLGVSCSQGLVVAGQYEYSLRPPSGWSCGEGNANTVCRNGTRRVIYSPGGDAG